MKKSLEETPQSADFHLRPSPVFLGEGIKGQIGDSQLPTAAYYFSNGISPFFMADNAIAKALSRPTSIAVHDDGYMPRQSM
jgi:hypothetical protein